jgi:Uma2 family endonuclease
MSTAEKIKLTEAQYLEFEEKSEVRHEFYNGDVFAMAGATPEHNRIKENLTGELYIQFGEGECQRVKIDASTFYTYPDIAIVCSPPEFDLTDRNALTNPQVIIEVLSPTSELYDRSAKFELYKQLTSIKEYVLVAQDKRFIESYCRQADDTWLYRTFTDSSERFQFSSIPVNISMAKLYARVIFPPASARSLRVANPDPSLPNPM